MNKMLLILLSLAVALTELPVAHAENALAVLRKDFTFPNKISGLPQKLSDFKDLQINSFTTNDGVKLRYWEAGKGEPLIFIPGWSANGAQFINILYLLQKNYHVYVLDPRNQGLSDTTSKGIRMARLAMDLKEFTEAAGIKSAYFCGWSMGASVVYSYMDLFGTNSIKKAVFIDEPVSILSRPGWSAQKKSEMGAIAATLEELFAALAPPKNPTKDADDLSSRAAMMDSKYYENSERFTQTFIKNDPNFMSLIMYDHANSDWSDVITNKINIPTAIFTGEWSRNVTSQHWMQKQIKGSKLFVYKKSEQGDHFLHFKNPKKFTNDLNNFLKE